MSRVMSLSLILFGLLSFSAAAQENLGQSTPAFRWYDGPESLLPKCLPTGEFRKVYLFEDAPAAKIRDTLGQLFPGAWLRPHPTMNGIIVTASPDVHATLALELPKLDVMPPSTLPPIRFLMNWPDRLEQLPEYLSLVVDGCSYALDLRKARLVITGSSPSIGKVKDQLSTLGAAPYQLEVFFVTTGLSELTWERRLFHDQSAEK